MAGEQGEWTRTSHRVREFNVPMVEKVIEKVIEVPRPYPVEVNQQAVHVEPSQAKVTVERRM